MPKSVFWPATLVIMGLIFLASNMGMLPAAFWNFWPLILIIVGLGGLLTSDRTEWLAETDSPSPKKKSNKKKPNMKMTRKELNKMAKSKGVKNPEKLPRKQAVIKAIKRK